MINSYIIISYGYTRDNVDWGSVIGLDGYIVQCLASGIKTMSLILMLAEREAEHSVTLAELYAVLLPSSQVWRKVCGFDPGSWQLLG